MLSLELQQEVCGKPDTIHSPLSSIYITHKLTGRLGTPWLTVLQSPCLPDRVKTEDAPQHQGLSQYSWDLGRRKHNLLTRSGHVTLKKKISISLSSW